MENNSIKRLAEQAKKRLARNGRLGLSHNQHVESKFNNYDTKFSSSYNKINFHEDEELYSKLKSILKSNSNTFSPIGQLVDQSVFKNLTPIEKDKYIVCLIEKFQYFLQKIEQENKMEQIS